MRGISVAARAGALGGALLLALVATTSAAEPAETIYRDAEPTLSPTIADGLFTAEATTICARAATAPPGTDPFDPGTLLPVVRLPQRPLKPMSFADALRSASSRAGKGRGAAGLRALRTGAGRTLEGAQVAAVALAVRGSNQGALAALLVARERAPNDGSLLVSAAVPLVQLGRPREALAFLDRARQLHRLGPALLGWDATAIAENNRGFALIALGRAHDAELALRRAIALEPELSEAEQNLAVALTCQGKSAPSLAARKAGEHRRKYDYVPLPPEWSPTVGESERPLAAQVFDLSAGKDAVLPGLPYPAEPQALGNAIDRWRALSDKLSAHLDELATRREALVTTWQQRSAHLPRITVRRQATIMSTASSGSLEPSIKPLFEALEPAAVATRASWADWATRFMTDQAACNNDAVCYRPRCMANTIDVHGRWLNAQNALDTAVRNYVRADGRHRAALAALVRDSTTRQIILLDAEASADREFKNLVDEAYDWGHRPWVFKADCIAGEEPPPVTPDPGALPQVVDPGACPPSVSGAQVKVDLHYFELGIGCDQVEFSGQTPGAVGGFDKVQVARDGKTTFVVGARGGGFGVDWESGIAVTTGKDGGIDDIAWRTGPSVTIGEGPLKFDPGVSQVDISLVGAIDYIPTAFGFSPPAS